MRVILTNQKRENILNEYKMNANDDNIFYCMADLWPI